MEKFDTVTFDWKGDRIRLGKDWQPAQTMLSGSNALSRARIADEEVLELREATKERELINPNLLPNENKTIKELLKEFTGLFAEDPKKPNRVHTRVQHCLDLEASTPIQVLPKRMPPAWEKTVSEQAKEMCKNGICRPSSSQWASDVVLVRKKDGTLRFAIDYRKLNAITKKDTYGLPNPLTILDKLDGSKYFTFLDVASAYWCVPRFTADFPGLRKGRNSTKRTEMSHRVF